MADDIPSGMPEEAPEAQPLGPEETEPDADAPDERSEDALPGIPSEGEPPTAG